MQYQRVTYVQPDSIAEQMGIAVGDCLVSLNGKPVHDILDYRFRIDADEVLLEFTRDNGDTQLYEIELEEDEDIGIAFDTGLMDHKRACKNKCIFCFIDQLPKGVRSSLKFKDDDWRLSFLMGNYVTLTNLKPGDLDRIIEQRISPLYVSVHATDATVRQQMMQNDDAGNILLMLQRLASAKIEFHTQIVLCRGINDGEILHRTISDLMALYPQCASLSVVPVGLTAHRDNCYPLRSFDEKSSNEVIDLVEDLAQSQYKRTGDHFVYCGDEFYVMAKRELPQVSYYGAFDQLENGVGMLPLFMDEANEAMVDVTRNEEAFSCTVATGEAAYDYIHSLAQQASNKSKNAINTVACKNIFFGGKVSVAGLLTGMDFIHGLDGKDLGDVLFIPDSTLKDGEGIFLDDMSLSELSGRLDIKIVPVPNDGATFVEMITTNRWRVDQ